MQVPVMAGPKPCLRHVPANICGSASSDGREGVCGRYTRMSSTAEATSDETQGGGGGVEAWGGLVLQKCSGLRYG